MHLGAALSGVLAAPLGALLAPPLCWGCEAPVRRGEPLCRHCRASLHRLAAEPVWLSGVSVWAPVAYSGPARDLVRALKFRGALAVADAMAAQIVANAPPELLGGGIRTCRSPAAPAANALPELLGARQELLAGVTLVPVPLHPRRLRSRGYNQAAAIADAVARRAGVQVADCLARSGPAVTQVGRHRAERRAGPAGEIRVAAAVPPRVLLVDDVVTTGATLAACRRALVTAGAVGVTAVAYARTLGR